MAGQNDVLHVADEASVPDCSASSPTGSPPTAPDRRVSATFLTHLAVDKRLAAATQAQALAAIVFLYRHVIDRPLSGLGDVPRARAPVRLPVVLTESEARRVLGATMLPAVVVAPLRDHLSVVRNPCTFTSSRPNAMPSSG